MRDNDTPTLMGSCIAKFDQGARQTRVSPTKLKPYFLGTKKMSEMQIPEQLSDVANQINEMLQKDDSFNVGTEENKFQLTLCLQYFAKSHSDQKGEDFHVTFAVDTIKFIRSLDKKSNWIMKSVESNEQNFDYCFMMIETKDSNVIMELAQMILGYMSQVDLEKVPEDE